MKDIAIQLNIGKTMVHNALTLYRESGSVANKVRLPKSRKTTQNDDRMMVLLSKRDPFKTSTHILNEIQPRLQREICSRTVRNRLTEAGLRGCIARKKPLVSKKNLSKRLQFAKEHAAKPLSFWQNILWSDETKINMFGSDGKVYVRRPPNKQNDPRYTLKTVKHGGGNIMVWGAFSWHGVGPIHRIVGRMDQHVYKGIIENVMIPYCSSSMPATYTFQQDNDPKHTSRLVKNYLLESNVAVLDWPAQSPDLNPIENLWGYVKRELKSHRCSSADQLYGVVENIWKNIPTGVCKKLVESMPRRCAQVIAAKGYPTKY